MGRWLAGGQLLVRVLRPQHVSIMLTVTGLLDTGRSADAPVVAALREQLR